MFILHNDAWFLKGFNTDFLNDHFLHQIKHPILVSLWDSDPGFLFGWCHQFILRFNNLSLHRKQLQSPQQNTQKHGGCHIGKPGQGESDGLLKTNDYLYNFTSKFSLYNLYGLFILIDSDQQHFKCKVWHLSCSFIISPELWAFPCAWKSKQAESSHCRLIIETLWTKPREDLELVKQSSTGMARVYTVRTQACNTM